MSEQMCEQRRERLRALMREQGIEALLISHAANRYYLSGFELHDVQLNESAGRLIVMADGKDWILTDSRYLDAARRLWEPERVFIYGADAPEDRGKPAAGGRGGGAGGCADSAEQPQPGAGRAYAGQAAAGRSQ